MSDQRMPTMSEMRAAYAVAMYDCTTRDERESADDVHEQFEAAFDRSIARHDAETAARVLEDAADAWHAENTGTAPRMYRWLCARAQAIREGKSNGESQ